MCKRTFSETELRTINPTLIQSSINWVHRAQNPATSIDRKSIKHNTCPKTRHTPKYRQVTKSIDPHCQPTFKELDSSSPSSATIYGRRAHRSIGHRAYGCHRSLQTWPDFRVYSACTLGPDYVRKTGVHMSILRIDRSSRSDIEARYASRHDVNKYAHDLQWLLAS